MRTIQVLEVIANQSHHTTILIEGLRDLTITEARRRLSQLEAIIGECKMRYLKRLECEARLIYSCFQLVLRKIGVTAAIIDIENNLQKARRLCQTFPYSAGLLTPIHLTVQRSMDTQHRITKTIYAEEHKAVFWTWPIHKAGALKKCPHQHIYSAVTWHGCPECGQEVEKTEDISSTPLRDEEFVLAMRTVSISFDGTAYRRQPS